MINVSQEYITKINSSSKQVGWYGNIALTNGKTYSFDATNLKQGQSTITRELCDSNSLRIGGACSAELKLAFMLDYDETYDIYLLNGVVVDKYEFYDATIVIYFRLYFDNNRYEDVPCGTYIVTEPERTRMVLTCTAYDYMQKFSMDCVSTLQGTPYSLLLTACSVCGVTLGNKPKDINLMPNGSASVAVYDPKNDIKTWRDVIRYVACMLGGNAVIKSDNKLYIIPYNTPSVRTIPEDDRVSLTLADYITNYYTITAINARVNVEEKVSITENGLTYKIGLNPLMQWALSASRRTAMTNILSVLANLDYAPFSGDFFCDPSFELGDVVTFTGNHALSSTKAVITKIVIPINGHMQMSCDGDDPYKQKAEEAASSEYSSETSGSVGDGVTFYDFQSDADVTVGSTEAEVIVIEYESNGSYRQEFKAELQIRVTTNEALNNGVYTNNDCRVIAKYYRNGEEYLGYTPEETFTDGTHLLHLFLIWNDKLRIPTSTFRVTLKAINGSVVVPAKFANARIMQSGTAYEDESNDLLYIEVDPRTPTKKKYNPGETLDYTGIIVYACYEDGSKERIENECSFNPSNGTYVTDSKEYILVKVTYVKDNKTYQTDFELDVHYLESIYVKQAPTKDDYFVGETLDLSGMKVYATYSDTQDVDVTANCTYNPASGTTLSTEGTQTINISYTESGVTKECQETVSVQKVMLEELIVVPPSKTVYEKGETLDYSGVSVTAKYNNGTQADVTGSCVFNPANGATAATSMSSCTVSYTEDGTTLSDSFELEVYEFTGIDVTTEPTNTSYWLGDETDYSGIVVTGEYSNGDTEDVTAECTYDPVNGSITTSLYQNRVVVSYLRSKDGKRYLAEFSIEVKEPYPFLKYVTYNIDTANRIIYVKTLIPEEIAADNIHNLVIPATYTDEESGITFDVKLIGDIA